MSGADPLDRLRHMLDHAREALGLMEGRSRADLDTDRLLNLGMVRLLEVIGEAAAQTPVEVRERYPHLPWREASDLRNRLIHGYDTVDFDRVWVILRDDLPPLVAALSLILESNEA